MAAHSYGLLVWRRRSTGVEVLLAHMGGPLWANKDVGAWTIPKGLSEDSDPSPWATACREFTEELGLPAPAGVSVELGDVVQSGGKRVTAWAVEHDLDPDAITPGEFDMTWPPRSGRLQRFPEIDRVRWMPPDEARELVVRAQAVFIDRLIDHLAEA